MSTATRGHHDTVGARERDRLLNIALRLDRNDRGRCRAVIFRVEDPLHREVCGPVRREDDIAVDRGVQAGPLPCTRHPDGPAGPEERADGQCPDGATEDRPARDVRHVNLDPPASGKFSYHEGGTRVRDSRFGREVSTLSQALDAPAGDPFGGRHPTSHERMTGLPWDASYRDGPAPWDIGRPQPAIARVATDGGFVGAVLDAGCGSGENALHLASLGLSVVGVDVAETALAIARENGRRPWARRRVRRVRCVRAAASWAHVRDGAGLRAVPHLRRR